jgi:hypothetical protein
LRPKFGTVVPEASESGRENDTFLEMRRTQVPYCWICERVSDARNGKIPACRFTDFPALRSGNDVELLQVFKERALYRRATLTQCAAKKEQETRMESDASSIVGC